MYKIISAYNKLCINNCYNKKGAIKKIPHFIYYINLIFKKLNGIIMQKGSMISIFA